MEASKRCNFHLLRAIRDSKLVRNAELSVLMALALRASDRQAKGTWSAYPSYSLLADDIGRGKSTVIAAVKTLLSLKLIKIIPRAHTSNVFILNYDHLEAVASRNQEERREQSLRRKSEKVTKLASQLSADNRFDNDDQPEPTKSFNEG